MEKTLMTCLALPETCMGDAISLLFLVKHFLEFINRAREPRSLKTGIRKVSWGGSPAFFLKY